MGLDFYESAKKPFGNICGYVHNVDMYKRENYVIIRLGLDSRYYLLRWIQN